MTAPSHALDPSLSTTLDTFLEVVLSKKAQNPVVLDVRKQTTIADLFIIASGRSHRQVTAMAEHVQRNLKKQKIKPLHIEGRKDGQWALMDYGDVVVHLFYAPVRQLYDLESLWMDARRVETPRLKAYLEAAQHDSDINDDDEMDDDHDDQF
jgi:ribosome-associated protein